MTRNTALILLLISAPLPAAELSQEFALCMDAGDGSTAGMLECIGAEYERQDQRLNRVYRQLMSQLGAERQQALKTAQRLWLQFSEANCAFYDDPDGGTSARLAANDCALRMRAERADELQRFLDQP